MTHRLRTLITLGALVLGASAGHAAPLAGPLSRPATPVAHPERAVLLGIARAGPRLVAAGERGIIALSDDGGRTWRQAAAVPTSVSLVCVAFATPRIGWAAGHGGTILRTFDGGEHWTIALDGIRAAALVARDVAAGRASTALRTLARQLVSDGPDAPFLAIAALDARRVVVAGANGLLLSTSDGGASWQSLVSRAADPDGRHYYAIAARDGRFYLAGEQGLFERSDDGGRSFRRVAAPYAGTFFAMRTFGRDGVLLAGLRGHAVWSSDGGRTFSAVRSPVPVSFSSSTPLANGALLTNQAGQLLRFDVAQRRIDLVPGPALFPLAGVALAADGAIVAVGLGGAARVPAVPGEPR